MTSRLRKFVLTSHISFSVGWFGAVAAFVALNITALTSENIETIRSAYFSMNLIGWYIILPFCFVSLPTGLVQSLGTQRGLFKHYWILVKLFLTVCSTILLLIHMQLISRGATMASETVFQNAELRDIGTQLLTKAGPALLVLLITIIISVYKPWSKIQLRQKSDNKLTTMEGKKVIKKSWGFKILIGLIILIIIFIIRHLAGGGMNRHSH